MTYNPFKDSSQKMRRRDGEYALSFAKVVSASSDSAHEVGIKPATTTGEVRTDTDPVPATVVVPQRGDVALPSVGDLVVVGALQNRMPIVLGTVYSKRSSIRPYDADDRHIGTDDGVTHLHGRFGVVPKRSDDPDDPDDGAIWYRTDISEYRGVEGGTTVSFDTTNV